MSSDWVVDYFGLPRTPCQHWVFKRRGDTPVLSWLSDLPWNIDFVRDNTLADQPVTIGSGIDPFFLSCAGYLDWVTSRPWLIATDEEILEHLHFTV